MPWTRVERPDFVESAKDYPFLDYVKYHPVPNLLGYYRAFRFGLVPEGSDCVRYLPYELERHVLSYAEPDRTFEKGGDSEFDIMAHHRRMTASAMMGLRGYRIAKALMEAEFSEFGMESDAEPLSGGQWSKATPESRFIYQGLTEAMDKIRRATLGFYQIPDFRLVMNPNTAMSVGQTSEIAGITKSAKQSSVLAQYEIPAKIAEIKVVVDDTVKLESGKDGSGVIRRGYAIPDNVAFIVARPGSLKAEPDSHVISTVSAFVGDIDMEVEEIHDEINRRRIGSVLSESDIQVAIPQTGFKITNLFQ